MLIIGLDPRVGLVKIRRENSISIHIRDDLAIVIEKRSGGVAELSCVPLCASTG